MESRVLLAANLGNQTFGALIPNRSQLVFTDIAAGSTGGSASAPTQTITLTNSSSTPITIGAGGVTILDDAGLAGDHAGLFHAVNWPALPLAIAPGATASFGVNFSADSLGVKGGVLRFSSNDPSKPTLDLALRGIGTASDANGTVSGDKEPSLQRILNAFQIPVIVGDANGEDTYDLPTPRPAGTPTDEVELQRLVKAGSGPVVIESLADYAFNTRTGPVGHYGYYLPGTPDAKTELFSVAANEYTSTNPSWGASFDPGAAAFSLYGQFNGSLFEINGLPRNVYGEDQFNTWDAVNHKKIRFFPLKNPDGSVVANAYVFAFEEFNSGYDSNDIIGIIRNVRGAADGPEIGTENLDRGAPGPTRLVFNRIQVQPPTGVVNGQTVTLPNNVVHDKATVRINNSGTGNLVINNVTLSDAANYRINTSGLAGAVIAPGSFRDFEVQFIATNGDIHDATLTISSNDADEPNTNIALSGFWQEQSEHGDEPTLAELVRVLGYGTSIVTGNELLNVPGDSGKVQRVGDELLSPYWRRADAARAVEVIELAAFHTHNTEAAFKWHYQGSSTTTTLFTHEAVDAQSLLPKVKGSSAVAAGVFKPTTQSGDTNPAFGFRVDGEWSDPSKNPQEKSGGGYGHHVRFWIARDAQGNVIPSTYLMAMDYNGINYDYDDNVYLIRNLRPAAANSPPVAPTGVQGASASNSSISLAWNAVSGAARYMVERRPAAGGAWVLLSENQTGTTYVDEGLSSGVAYQYRVRAVSSAEGVSVESAPATAAAGVSVPPDPTPSPVGVSINDVSVTEPSGGTATARFTVTLSGASTGAIVVNYTTADGNAVAGSDYAAASGALTFSPGETSKTIDVAVLADSLTEGVESFSVTLSVASGNAAISDRFGAATVIDTPPGGTPPPPGTPDAIAFGGKTKATYLGVDNRVVTLTLKGPGQGQVIPLGNGVVQVQLTGTSAGSSLTIKGRTTIDRLAVEGSLKSISAKTADLAGDMSVSGSLAKLVLGNASGGHSIVIGPGSALAAQFASVMDMSLSAPAISKLVAGAWSSSDGTIETIQTSALSSFTTKGDLAANITADQLGKLSVSGTLASSTLRIGGGIGKITAGALRDSTILSGVGAQVTGLPTGADAFANPASFISSVSVKSKSPGSFSNTMIAAASIGSLSLGAIASDNGGTPDGVAAMSIRAVAGILADSSRLKLKNLDAPEQSTSSGDFVLRLF